MATTIRFNLTRCIMSAGDFDTDYRYMRAGASGSTFPLPKDRTVRIAPDSGNTRYVMWRWSDSVSADEWEVVRNDRAWKCHRYAGEDLMGLPISAGRIVMTDASGNVRFDTNEKLFNPTNYVTGSYTASNYSAQTTWDGSNASSHTDTSSTAQDNTYTLASINSSANTVRGAFKASASYGGFSNTSWYNASGSYVHMWQGGAYGSPTLTCGQINVCACAVYTFFCEGGSLKLRGQVYMSNEPGYCLGGATTNTLTMIGPTFDYKLFCGTFV